MCNVRPSKGIFLIILLILDNSTVSAASFHQFSQRVEARSAPLHRQHAATHTLRHSHFLCSVLGLPSSITFTQRIFPMSTIAALRSATELAVH